MADPINPRHYKKSPSGIECIEITRHMNHNLGNAIDYIWRVAAGGKPGVDPIEDLDKAVWYLRDEQERLRGQREVGARLADFVPERPHEPNPALAAE